MLGVVSKLHMKAQQNPKNEEIFHPSLFYPSNIFDVRAGQSKVESSSSRVKRKLNVRAFVYLGNEGGGVALKKIIVHTCPVGRLFVTEMDSRRWARIIFNEISSWFHR